MEDLKSSSQETPRAYRVWLIGILLAGLATRSIICLEYLARNPFAETPVNDAEVYWSWAGEIAGGQLVLADQPFFSAPFYPYLLALLRILGCNLGWVVILQSFLDLCTAYLLARAVRGRFGGRVSLIAAAIFLVLLEPASAALRILPSPWHLFLVTLCYASILAFGHRPSRKRATALGSAVGLLCLTYAPALVLIPILGIWSWRRHASHHSGRGASWVLVGVAVVWIIPATVHNWLAVGEFIPLQSGSGMTLLQGNQERSRGGYTAVEGISKHRDQMHRDALRLYREQVGEEGTWNVVDRYWRSRALAFWSSSPRAALELAARKLYWLVSSKNYGEIHAPLSEIRLGIQRSLLVTPVALPWIMGLSLLGIGRWSRRPAFHFPELLLAALPVVVIVVFFYSPRYRIPAVPMLAVAAACAVDWAVFRSSQARVRIALAAALALGIGLGPINDALGFDRPMDAFQAQNLAYVLSQQGEIELAVEWQRRGIELGSDGATSLLDLGTLLKQSDREEEALDAYAQSLALAPFRPEFTLNVARQLFARQRYAEAEAVLARASQTWKSNTGILGMLAIAQFQQARFLPAAETLRLATDLDPSNLALRKGHASVLLELERWPEALSQIESILRSWPDDEETEILKRRAEAGLASSHGG